MPRAWLPQAGVNYLIPTSETEGTFYSPRSYLRPLHCPCYPPISALAYPSPLPIIGFNSEDLAIDPRPSTLNPDLSLSLLSPRPLLLIPLQSLRSGSLLSPSKFSSAPYTAAPFGPYAERPFQGKLTCLLFLSRVFPPLAFEISCHMDKDYKSLTLGSQTCVG